jgi:murein DD-endopeptidase MepM/ murein hydrolase activator NlpD
LHAARAARAALAGAWGRLGRHGLLLGLVAAVLAAELGLALSGRAAAGPGAPPPPRRAADAGAPLAFAPPPAVGPIRLAPRGEPLAPATSRPPDDVGPLQAVHPLAEGETLGEVAGRYGVTVETLVWANGLQRGDALAAGQELRVPRVSGVLYVVAAGDTAESVAARFGVPAGLVAGLAAGGGLLPGSEILIPGGRGELPQDWLSAVGGLEGLRGRGVVAAAVVRAAQTNLRAGPSTEHPRLTQLDAGRRVALRARNGDWLQVEIGAVRGWLRADMVAAAPDEVAALPVSSDFPAPPPRWVWPARGTLTSGFGPRWRRFHNGIDIANRAWTPIVAARAGTVKEAGWCSGYGYCVKLRHGGGVETIYGHLIAQPVVTEGDQVSAGELIGHMGSTYDRAGGGYSTGVHLHFTVLVNGKAVNPLRFLP